MAQDQKYYVYRAHLAQSLLANGYEGKVVPNVLHPEKTAWEFSLSPELARFIRDYYRDRYLTVPAFLLNFIAENGGEEGDQ